MTLPAFAHEVLRELEGAIQVAIWRGQAHRRVEQLDSLYSKVDIVRYWLDVAEFSDRLIMRRMEESEFGREMLVRFDATPQPSTPTTY